MQCKIYELPEITFVGGKTQEIRFNLLEQDGTYYNASHIQSADFSVCNYSLKTGTPLFSVTPEIVGEAESSHTIKATISPKLTVDLYGKYIYQLTLKDDNDNIEIPSQGILNITRNINQSFITS